MKSSKILFASISVFVSLASFAEKREYFPDTRYDKYSAIPQGYAKDFYAEKEFTLETWFEGPYATAHWLGLRNYLEDKGVTFDLSYLGNFAANPSGGYSKGADFSSSVNMGLGLNFGKLANVGALEGWSLKNTWVWRSGSSLSQDRLGNLFPAQQNYGSQTINLQSLFLEYTTKIFGDGSNIRFKFGRMAAADDFLNKPIYALYMNNAFDGTPKGIFMQMPFSAYPGSTWGAFIRVDKHQGLYGKAGVYQINNYKQDNSHGLDFSMKNADGVNASFEFGWDINHDDSGRSPGNISFGAMFDWYNAEHFDNPSEYSHFNSSIFLQLDYMIWNMGPVNRDAGYLIKRSKTGDIYRDLRGIVAWTVIQYSPCDEISQMPFFINGGLFFNAPFASRPDDVLAFGVAYGKCSDKITDPNRDGYEVLLELDYKLQINRFLFVQPNIQAVFSPSTRPNALVLGIQFGIGI